MTRLLRPVLILCCQLVAVLAGAQHRLQLVPDGPLPKRVEATVELPSAAAVRDHARQLLTALHRAGHLEASVDSCSTDTVAGTSRCYVHVGDAYRWAHLSADGVPGEIASGARFRERGFAGRPIAPAQLANLFEELLRYAEDHGHPFASVRLEDVAPEGDGLRATVVMDKGRTVVIDSVLVKGSARTNMRYLQTHLGIRPGDLYNEALVRAVERRTRELPFVQQRQRPYVQFTPERTKLYLFLDARKASSVNGIIGVQPNAVTGRVGVTGDLDLRLRNALRRGEGIELNWRSLQDATQDLKVRLELPALFGSPFGTDLSLKLFKRDTTFLEVNARAAITYLAGRGDKLSVFVNDRSSTRLGTDLLFQPGLADVKLLTYGASVERERFDYRFNPRRGHALQLEGAFGNKTSTTAVRGEASPPPDVRTQQYEFTGRGILHLPLKQRSTLRLVGQGGAMLNEVLFRNELFRMGGLRTLRGVDEASIICDAYAIGTLEYRFVYEENANFFAFVEQAYWEDNTQEANVNDNPLGFGIGATFETKAGLFNLTYALARQFGNPIEVRDGKVHFGFTSLF
jgi:outer membrane protein assembly factor BamA